MELISSYLEEIASHSDEILRHSDWATLGDPEVASQIFHRPLRYRDLEFNQMWGKSRMMLVIQDWICSSLMEEYHPLLDQDNDIEDRIYSILLRLNPTLIRHIQYRPSQEDMIEFATRNPKSYRHLPDEYHTPENALLLFERNPRVFLGTPNRLKTQELCYLAVQHNPGWLRYVPGHLQDNDLINVALVQCPHILRCVNRSSPSYEYYRQLREDLL